MSVLELKAKDYVCSQEEPCKEGGGDCDDNADCMGSLVCGRNNCQDFNPLATTSADCCESKGKQSSHILNSIPPYTYILENECSGMSDERSCCSKEEPYKRRLEIVTIMQNAVVLLSAEEITVRILIP